MLTTLGGVVWWQMVGIRLVFSKATGSTPGHSTAV